MTRSQFLRLPGLALSALPLAAQRNKPKEKEKSKDKSMRIAVVSFKIQREGGLISLEGTVRNTSERPLKGITLFLEFLEPGGRMISRMTHTVSEDEVLPGDDGEFLAQTPDQVRAVHVRLDAEDKDGRYLLVDKPGPHTIE